MNDLAPPLARELKNRVNTAARHAIAQEIDVYRRNIWWARQHSYDWMVKANQTSINALLTLGRERFPRPHGRACLSCSRRPVFVTMGHTTTDFCQACLERIEESQNRRNYR